MTCVKARYAVYGAQEFPMEIHASSVLIFQSNIPQAFRILEADGCECDNLCCGKCFTVDFEEVKTAPTECKEKCFQMSHLPIFTIVKSISQL